MKWKFNVGDVLFKGDDCFTVTAYYATCVNTALVSYEYWYLDKMGTLYNEKDLLSYKDYMNNKYSNIGSSHTAAAQPIINMPNLPYDPYIYTISTGAGKTWNRTLDFVAPEKLITMPQKCTCGAHSVKDSRHSGWCDIKN